ELQWGRRWDSPEGRARAPFALHGVGASMGPAMGRAGRIEMALGGKKALPPLQWGRRWDSPEGRDVHELHLDGIDAASMGPAMGLAGREQAGRLGTLRHHEL